MRCAVAVLAVSLGGAALAAPPAGVRGAIVCFYAGRVACADLEDGT